MTKIPTGHIIEFMIGQTVYLKTDVEQRARLVTGISLRPMGSIGYYLSFEASESFHYGLEISGERDVILATGG